MGITILEPDSISFPIEQRPLIKILVNHNNYNPTFSIESRINDPAETVVHQVVQLSDGNNQFKNFAVSMEDIDDQVIVTFGPAEKTPEENQAFYGNIQKLIPPQEDGSVGSVDLRDVKIAGDIAILSRPYPVFFKLEFLNPEYNALISYKAIE